MYLVLSVVQCLFSLCASIMLILCGMLSPHYLRVCVSCRCGSSATPTPTTRTPRRPTICCAALPVRGTSCGATQTSAPTTSLPLPLLPPLPHHTPLLSIPPPHLHHLHQQGKAPGAGWRASRTPPRRDINSPQLPLPINSPLLALRAPPPNDIRWPRAG